MKKIIIVTALIAGPCFADVSDLYTPIGLGASRLIYHSHVNNNTASRPCLSIDGCKGGPYVDPTRLATQIAGGYTVQHKDFFTGYAIQSAGERTSIQPLSKVYSSRPPWNVAGVDYPVGIPTSSLPLKIPGVNALPTPCAASIVGPGTLVNQVLCQVDKGATFTGSVAGNTLTVSSIYATPANPLNNPLKIGSTVTDSSGFIAKISTLGTGTGGLGTYLLDNTTLSGTHFSIGGLVIDGWDFSVNNGVYLDLHWDIDGAVVIKNSKFAYGSNFAAGGPFASSAQLINLASAGSLLFMNNYVDANGPSSAAEGSNLYLSITSSHYAQSFYYNAFLRNRARVISATSYSEPVIGDVFLKYNYIEGLGYKTQEPHEEITLYAYTGTMNNYIAQYNTWLQPSTVFMDTTMCGDLPCTNGGTGVFSPSLSIPDSILLNFVVDHETHVGNFAYVNGNYVDKQTMGAAGAEMQMATFTNVTFTNNWIDPTGAWYCFTTPGIAPIPNLTLGGNINLLTGGSANGLGGASGTASLSGGVLTVNSISVAGVGVGSIVVLAAGTVTIVSRGTGTGGIGTYNVNNTTLSSANAAFNVYGDQCSGNGTFYVH